MIEPRRFTTREEIENDLPIYLLQAAVDTRFYIEQYRFYKGSDGRAHVDPCQMPCDFWHSVDYMALSDPIDAVASSLFDSAKED